MLAMGSVLSELFNLDFLDAAGKAWTGLYQIKVSVEGLNGEEAVEKLAQPEEL